MTPDRGFEQASTGTAIAGRRARMLVVEDNPVDQQHLVALLEAAGYEVVTAGNGVEAVARYREAQPDVVLMDMCMPVMGGCEATRIIKAEAGEGSVSVIFLTGMDDDVSFLAAMDAGADDCLAKPFNPERLRVKLVRQLRQLELYRTIQREREDLRRYQMQQEEDLELARHIHERLARSEWLDMPNVRRAVLPLQVANGDIILGALGPRGGQVFLLADVTGHGLGAATCAMIACDVFHSMVKKGFRISQIAAQLNTRLRGALPTGRFLAACLLEIYPEGRVLEIWNGGVPDAYVLDATGTLKASAHSRHVPLGVLEDDQFDGQTQVLDIVGGDRIIVYSDGIIEAANAEGEVFGSARLLACLSADPARPGTEAVAAAIARFLAGAPQTDDMSLLEILCVPSPEQCAAAASPRPSVTPVPMEWRLRLELGADALRNVDPLPLLLHAICDVQQLGDRREDIYLILAELYSNALEHGLLGLSSQLKSFPDGFAQYYAERDARLGALRDGRLVFDIRQAPPGEGGALHVRLEQSGAGFDLDEVQEQRTLSDGYFGRGVRLVRSVCRSLEYSEGGRIVEAVYDWNGCSAPTHDRSSRRDSDDPVPALNVGDQRRSIPSILS